MRLWLEDIMNKHFVIEKYRSSDGMGAAKRVLAHKELALVALGSDSCLGSLRLLAHRLGAQARLYTHRLTQREYSLGHQNKHLKVLLEQALAQEGLKGIVIYASCMDVLTSWELRAEELELENPRKIPIEVLYRGPMVRRKKSPGLKLQQIFKEWGISCDTQNPEGVSEAYEASELPSFISCIMENQQDCYYLLLTPGGCASCLELLPKEKQLLVYSTSFDDLFVANLDVEQMAEAILMRIPSDKRLVLLQTIVPKAIGLDLEELCYLLEEQGRTVEYKTF